ncbi:penicillin-binding protein [Cytobacillus spongiae]|uniref:transglycosylase domain-containing protein n=1 Tax=Cytobacillus spongiae TaxID=2901381 RepID=UPI001F476169|nr:transglycosylase domain-containing protein [Cytobacillus spongiae]UII55366.1 penicillin-binding protein [Cytobacillus spongiae]
MRTITGYIIIFIFFPLFLYIASLLADETKQVQSFHEIIDGKINVQQTNLTQTSYLKDRNGNTISEMDRPMNRIYLPSGQIPPFLKDIFIVSEDQHFYEHIGFDLTAIGRALATNIQSKEIEQGASTITQQLARNLYLNHEQTYNRKLSEILYAYEIERTYSKDEILEAYLNAIYFQNGAYGIEAAAQFYFQKTTGKLTKSELAFLASIPNNPSLYDPLTHFNYTKKRQERLVDQMSAAGYLNTEEAEAIKGQPISLNVKKRTDIHPDYVAYVEAELAELIAQQEDWDQSADSESRRATLETRVKNIIGSGIIIETALDPSLQMKAKSAVKSRLPYSDVEGSAAVIDHERHEILALVGGKNYKKYDFHRGYQAYRQPGSAIKPLIAYAPYIERTKGALTEQISSDAFCKDGYCPENYGGSRGGMISLETAFIYSFNTPAVRLLDRVGIESSFKDLEAFQFKKVVEQDKVLPAAVGGFTFGMTPLELTGAYTTFANAGSYQPPRAIRKVTSLNGEVLYEWQDQPVQVWSKQTVDHIRQLMKKTVQSGTAKQAYFPNTYVGGKTGTTNDYKDFWFVGLTDRLTAGVWVGKDTPQNMKAIEASVPELLIWRDIMNGYE